MVSLCESIHYMISVEPMNELNFTYPEELQIYSSISALEVDQQRCLIFPRLLYPPNSVPVYVVKA